MPELRVQAPADTSPLRRALALLQDLEKLGSKAGVVLQTVQDVVKSLCDDRLVESDKIGSGNFFWSFPSKALVAKKTRLETLESSLAAEQKAIADMEARLAALSAGREDSASRTKDLAELGALRVQKAELEAAVKAYGDSDPEALKEMQKKVGRWGGWRRRGGRRGPCNHARARGLRGGALATTRTHRPRRHLPAGGDCEEGGRPVRSAARASSWSRLRVQLCA